MRIELSDLRSMIQFRLSDPEFAAFAIERLISPLPQNVKHVLANADIKLAFDQLQGIATCEVQFEGRCTIAPCTQELDFFCNLVRIDLGVTQLKFSGTDGVWGVFYDPFNCNWIFEFLGES